MLSLNRWNMACLKINLHCLVLFALFGAGDASAQNLVQNGGFENSGSGWAWGVAGNATATCTIDATQHHWEGHSVLLTYSGASGGGMYGRMNQTISGLTVGTTYYAYIWCKGSSVGTQAIFASGSNWQFRQSIPSGTYDWTCVKLSFQADATSEDLMVFVQDPTSSLWVDDVYLTTNPMVDVSTLGIVGDGTTDVTSALNSALSQDKFLYLPPGTYCVSNTLTMPANSIIWGAGASSIIEQTSTSAPNILAATGTDSAFINNLEISGAEFTGSTTQMALIFDKVSNVVVRNCYAMTLGLVTIGNTQSSYSSFTSESDLNHNVLVDYNDVESTAASPSYSVDGITFNYTTDSQAYYNTVSYHQAGIDWWGGNANADGAMANPRWARRIDISGNTVSNSHGGGIWGSMGQNVTVEDNSISTSQDVGLDFEGCMDCTATSNTVTDGHNGCLSTFFVASDITFANNTVTSSVSSYPLFRLYNSSENPIYVPSVTLSGNTFSTTSGISTIDDASGPGCVTITGNTLNNVQIHFDFSTNGYAPVVTNNTVTYTHDVTTAMAGIYINEVWGPPILTGNTVTYSGATQTNKIGIQVQTIYTGLTATVENNTTQGFGSADIDVYSNSDNTTADIMDNVTEGLVMEGGNTQNLTVNQSGNENSAGEEASWTWLQ